MNPKTIPLDELRIATPCRADWNRMTGDERARFCQACHKNVYDVSQMTRAQVQQLIREKEGDVCLRLHRRADGTVITSDCPVGQTNTARPLWWGFVALIALLSAGLTGCNSSRAKAEDETATVRSAARIPIEVAPTPTPIVKTPEFVPSNDPQIPITNVSPGDSLPRVDMGAPMLPVSTPKPAPPKPAPPKSAKSRRHRQLKSLRNTPLWAA